MSTGTVLVARLDNAGDVLLAGPAVRAVAHGSQRVVFVAGPAGAEAAGQLPGVDEVVRFDAPWVGYRPPAVDGDALSAFVAEIAGAGATKAVVFGSSHQSPLPLALLLRLAGVPFIGAISHDYPGSLLDVRHHPAAGHEVERALSLAEACGFPAPPGDDGRLRLRGPLPTERPIEAPYVVVHPGASVSARALPVDLASTVLGLLLRRGRNVVVTGGPDERALTRRVAGRPRPRVRDLGGRTDLAGLAGVIAGADAVVCGNSLPAHLAAAVGTPVVSVFAPVVPLAQWGPYGVRNVVFGEQSAHCAGCRARECPVPGQPCIGVVSALDVADAVDDVVAEDPRSRQSDPHNPRRRTA